MSAIIAPPGVSSITFTLKSFGTESNYDFLTLESCNDKTCSTTKQLGKYSGANLPTPVTSSTGILKIKWYSDGSVVYPGWAADWSSTGEQPS